jgi:hypothetical protein
LSTRDGAEFDTAKTVPYAQRHADAAVPVDVLAELRPARQPDLARRPRAAGI